MTETEPHVRLREIRTQRRLSARQAARQIGVSHSVYLDWESGANSPSLSYRDSVRDWSGGKIASRSWPPTRQERRVAALRAKKLAEGKDEAARVESMRQVESR